MESHELWCWSYRLPSNNQEVKDLRSLATFCKVGSVISASSAVYFSKDINYGQLSFNADFFATLQEHLSHFYFWIVSQSYVSTVTQSYVAFGLQAVYSVFAAGFLGAGIYYSKKANGLEQKIFQEEQELEMNVQENNHRR